AVARRCERRSPETIHPKPTSHRSRASGEHQARREARLLCLVSQRRGPFRLCEGCQSGATHLEAELDHKLGEGTGSRGIASSSRRASKGPGCHCASPLTTSTTTARRRPVPGAVEAGTIPVEG